ncbi:MAG: D-2-hydroxyacid dehydrogenase [Lachnospiraceae bacterium]|nr:D-2-hydroxyacid dehydrogenase [Lachnospiraceae bacterium]
MKKIIITLPLEESETEEFYSAAGGERGGYEPVFKNGEQLTAEDVKDASAIVGMVPEDLLSGCECLEWLQLGWAGAETYCSNGLLKEDVVLTNASGAYGDAVSEHMAALTLALACSLNIYIRQQEKRHWELQWRRAVLAGSTVLVYGMGDIGTHYAAIMKSMGCHVIGISRTKKMKREFFDEQYVADEALQVIGRADVVALALPGGDDTRHIINKEAVKKMKSGAVLINAGRGSTVDTMALIDGLSQGIIAGAGLDVFEDEPLGDSELWNMENVIITPHAAGKLESEYNRRKVVELCLDNLHRYTQGEELLHVVDRKLAY